MSSDLLTRAADAMVAEAERLEALDRGAGHPLYVEGVRGADLHVWAHDPADGEDDDDDICVADVLPEMDMPTMADLIAHRRNTVARDAATFRATADLLREAARVYDSEIPEHNLSLLVARAFLGETK